MGRFSGIGKTSAPNYEAGDWATEGVKTNPTTGVLFADTGQLAEGIYDFDILAVGGAAGGADLQHRNAGNTANIKAQAIFISASTMTYPWHIRGLKMAANERLRMVCYWNYTGVYQGSIIWVQRA